MSKEESDQQAYINELEQRINAISLQLLFADVNGMSIIEKKDLEARKAALESDLDAAKRQK